METYNIKVVMTYEAEVDIEAETLEEAEKTAIDMAGDGILLRNAELTDAHIEA